MIQKKCTQQEKQPQPVGVGPMTASGTRTLQLPSLPDQEAQEGPELKQKVVITKGSSRKQTDVVVSSVHLFLENYGYFIVLQ